VAWPWGFVQRIRRFLKGDLALGPPDNVDVHVLMDVIPHELSRHGLGRHDSSALLNPPVIDPSSPSMEKAFRAAEPNARLGHTLPVRALQKGFKGWLARFGSRLLFRLARPLTRPQSQFNQAVLYMLRSVHRDVSRHERVWSLQTEQLRSVEEQLTVRIQRLTERVRTLENELAVQRRCA
jgi:hypothetical protein